MYFFVHIVVLVLNYKENKEGKIQFLFNWSCKN